LQGKEDDVVLNGAEERRFIWLIGILRVFRRCPAARDAVTARSRGR
jgi:hypothetical protein